MAKKYNSQFSGSEIDEGVRFALNVKRESIIQSVDAHDTVAVTKPSIIFRHGSDEIHTEARYPE